MKLTRRSFLQASAVAGGGALITGCPGRKPATSTIAEAKTAPFPRQAFQPRFPGACRVPFPCYSA